MASCENNWDNVPKKSKELRSLDNETTHVIVEFNDQGSKSIELALRSWLVCEKRRWHCYWPTGANMQFAADYVKKGKTSQKSWAKHKVEIMAEATNYEQGIRRLNRLVDGADPGKVKSFMRSSEAPTQIIDESKNYDASNVLQHRTQDGAISQFYDDEDVWSDSGSTASINTLRVEERQSRMKLVEGLKRTGTEAPATESVRGTAPDLEESCLNALITAVETRLRKKMSRVEQNVLFEVRSQFKNLLRVVVPSASLKSIGETISKCKETLGVEEIKCCTLEEFDIMEEKLGEEECRKAMKTWMLLMQNGGRDLKDSISKILTEYISKSVQLQFSGSGRKVKGAGKKDYSATYAFACMKEILLDVHSADPTVIRSAVGKWLSGAGDREGGKKARSSSV